MNNSLKSDKFRPAGYAFLILKFDLQILPHWHTSEIGGSVHQRFVESDAHIREIFPKDYWPGDVQLNQLEFALKYDGINLEILSEVFSKVDIKNLVSWITAKPQGQYTRRIWYLYEWMTGNQLQIEDLTNGNYIDLLNKDKYYTAQDQMIRRQRIRDNMLGNSNFCPVVRRTKTMLEFENSDLSKRCRNILANYPAEFLKRAVSYGIRKKLNHRLLSSILHPIAPEQSVLLHYCTLPRKMILSTKIH